MDNEKPKGQWLTDLLTEVDMTPADLCRATGIDSAVISYIRSGKRGIGPKNAKKIGKATNRTAEEILRLAGELETQENPDPLTQEGTLILQQLKGQTKETALKFLRITLQVAQEQGEYDAGKEERKPRPSAAK